VTYCGVYGRHFLKRQHKLYLILCVSIFLKWTNLRLLVNVQRPKVFQLKAPPDSLTRGSIPLDPAGGSAPRLPIIGASHLYLGGSNSLKPALSIGLFCQFQTDCPNYFTVKLSGGKFAIKLGPIVQDPTTHTVCRYTTSWNTNALN